VDPSPLVGKTALITGGGRGIGRACAEAFAAAGVRVAVASRTASQLRDVVRDIEAGQGIALAVPTDVTDYDQCTALTERVEAALGPVDILINNAGGWEGSAVLADCDPDEWAGTIQQNLISVFNVSRAVLPGMVERGRGRIINVGSGTGYVCSPRRSAYGTSKAAVAYLTRVMAEEVWEHGIDVNEVVPGPVATELTGGAFVAGKAPAFAASERVKEPAEVAELVVWVASRPERGPTGQMFSLARRSLL
jgi:3-oxoacyl-[acyl-carrier protein] reductase